MPSAASYVVSIDQSMQGSSTVFFATLFTGTSHHAICSVWLTYKIFPKIIHLDVSQHSRHYTIK